MNRNKVFWWRSSLLKCLAARDNLAKVTKLFLKKSHYSADKIGLNITILFKMAFFCILNVSKTKNVSIYQKKAFDLDLSLSITLSRLMSHSVVIQTSQLWALITRDLCIFGRWNIVFLKVDQILNINKVFLRRSILLRCLAVRDNLAKVTKLFLKKIITVSAR